MGDAMPSARQGAQLNAAVSATSGAAAPSALSYSFVLPCLVSVTVPLSSTVDPEEMKTPRLHVVAVKPLLRAAFGPDRRLYIAFGDGGG